ncbi:Cyclic amp receptor protein a, partial [Globisporangium splendens]
MSETILGFMDLVVPALLPQMVLESPLPQGAGAAGSDDDASSFVKALQQQMASEASTARTIVVVCSSVSLIAALALILCFLAFQESRRCGRRLLLCLHVADAGAACAWLLVLWVPEANPDAGAGSYTTPGVCYAQGYLLLFFLLASYLWTGCFAFHLFQLLGRRVKAPEVYEARYQLVSWGVPLLAVLHVYLQQALGYHLVGESGLPWCWLRSWSDFEWVTGTVYVQLGVFYGPVLLIWLHNIVTYLSLLYKMRSLLTRYVWPAKRRDLDQSGDANLLPDARVQRRVLPHTYVWLCPTALPGAHYNMVPVAVDFASCTQSTY